MVIEGDEARKMITAEESSLRSTEEASQNQIDEWTLFRDANIKEGATGGESSSRYLVLSAYIGTMIIIWVISKIAGNTNAGATLLTAICAIISFYPVLGYVINPHKETPTQKEDTFLNAKYQGLEGNCWND